jgi:hypothetical protein
MHERVDELRQHHVAVLGVGQDLALLCGMTA